MLGHEKDRTGAKDGGKRSAQAPVQQARKAKKSRWGISRAEETLEKLKAEGGGGGGLKFVWLSNARR